MKKIYILLIAALFAVTNTIAQSAPGTYTGTFKPNVNGCTTNNTTCTVGTVTNFYAGSYYQGGTGSSQDTRSRTAGAEWKFYNVTKDPADASVQVNAIIKIEAIFGAQIVKFDDDQATDINGTLLPNLFAPVIKANSTLNKSDKAGYVQYKITFYKDKGASKWDMQNYTEEIQLTGMNYVHYDIDGLNGNYYHLRETGVVKEITGSNPVVKVNAVNDLNAYNYTGDGLNWRGYMGSSASRNGTTKCAEGVASFTFNGALSTVTFRMGYNYDYTGNGNNNQNGLNDAPDRLYGSAFECFSFPQPAILPVKLLSFSGSYTSNATKLNWETESEVNFDHYEIERSSNGSDFAYAGRISAQTGNLKKQYSYTDNLASANGNLFYYRLKMIDIDGKFKFSNVILIRRDAKAINGISISPNPITGNGGATVRIVSATTGKIDLRVIDMTGKVVLQQQSRVSQGMNSISINNISYLQSGIYTVQVLQSDEAISTKISIVK